MSRKGGTCTRVCQPGQSQVLSENPSRGGSWDEALMELAGPRGGPGEAARKYSGGHAFARTENEPQMPFPGGISVCLSNS